ncbi:MAG: hypothetical protein D6714_14425 [Bacteroidetes bacterium]|nr:MAG: hypothetical protein D6714_14425 [Bacteroidota bacterium]
MFLGLSVGLSAQESVVNGVKVKNLTEVNTEYLEYSPIPFQNGLMFTSSRGKGGLLSCPPPESVGFSDLYFAPKGGNGHYGEAKKMKGKINGKYNDGVPTVVPGGARMYISRNNNEGKNVKDLIDRKIYLAEKVEDAWTNLTEFPFNSDTFSTCHPALSADGQKMVFSSNRPGGHGGMDLYMTTLRDGKWSQPVNLGPEINTPGNEIFPFLDQDGNLFFSSDGLDGGMGGLDIWAARESSPGQWTLLTNMGAPINSVADDLSFYSAPGGSEGFFASNREGGLGMDDIYHWEAEGEPLEAVVVIYDEDTGELLEKVPVEVTPVKINSPMGLVYGKDAVTQKQTFQTDPVGALKYGVVKDAEYAIHAEKEGYIPADRLVTTLELTKDGEYRIPLKRDKILFNLDGLVVNKKTNAPIPMADIVIIDRTTGERVPMVADGEGSFRVEIDCKHDYQIVASKAGFGDDTIDLTGLVADCQAGKVERPILRLPPIIRIAVEDVYFDFDKATLRPEGKQALDKVVTYLNEYPSLEILLTAHTDSRGTKQYNMGLSNRRAKSCMDYIISQGVDASRLDWKGYGESQLVNECADGVPCSEEKHQQNRRVEVIVTKFNEENVIIKDNH